MPAIPMTPTPSDPPAHPSSFLQFEEKGPAILIGGTAVEARFDERAFDDGLFTAWGIARPEQLRRAVRKRRAEFLAGRILAARAMAALGRPEAQVAIGARREPVWPHGLTGSISHTNGRAICALTAEEGMALGIDLEQILTADRAAGIARRIVTAQEEETIPVGLPHASWLTAVFSAKESLYKALHPAVGRFFDFPAARVTDFSSSALSLVLTDALTPALPAGRRFDLGLDFRDDHVLTWLVSPLSG